MFHTRICSLCWRVFFLFLWKLQSSWFHQKESAPAFHFPSFIHLFPAAVSIPYIYSPIPHLGRTGVVENIPQHDFNSAVYLWGWRGGLPNSTSHQTMSESSLSFLGYHLLKFMSKMIFLFPCLVAPSESSLVLFLAFVFILFTIFSFLCYLYLGVPVPGVFCMRHRLPWNTVPLLILKPAQQQLNDWLSGCYRENSWIKTDVMLGSL